MFYGTEKNNIDVPHIICRSISQSNSEDTDQINAKNE